MNDSRRLKLIASLDGVIAALDGGSAAARLAGCSPQAITNALARGRLPASTFLIFSDALARRGYRAAPELWGIKGSSRRR